MSSESNSGPLTYCLICIRTATTVSTARRTAGRVGCAGHGAKEALVKRGFLLTSLSPETPPRLLARRRSLFRCGHGWGTEQH